MTARSRKRRDRNKKIKADKRKNKELDRIRKQMGILDEDAKGFMQKIKDITNGVDAETIQKKKDEELKRIKQEFLEDIGKKNDKAKTMKVTNEKTGIVHIYNTNTMKDQFGSHPVWYHANNMKRKIKKRSGKGDNKRNKYNMTWKGTMLPL